MKKLGLILALVAMAFGWASCDKSNDYMKFVGIWGVERIDYYNIDYAGEPVEASFRTYFFTPGDPDNGIDLVFREDRTGEMRDRSRDTLKVPVVENNEIVDTLTIICPDTTLVTRFTYSYHKDDATLYMNMLVEHPFTYMMRINLLTDECFIYENQYDKWDVERARMIRISDDPSAAKSKGTSKPVSRPRREGSLFSNY